MSPRPREPDLWNVLHDGSIKAISGSVPGKVQLTVAIPYLCDLLEDPGETLLITLQDCSCFSFKPWDRENSLTDLAAISALDLEILSIDAHGGIVCAISAVPGGILTTEAAGFSLALDTGRPIQLEALLAAAKSYWDAFDTPNP
jgi:hypothetical protein